jgi:hypothetical protein
MRKQAATTAEQVPGARLASLRLIKILKNQNLGVIMPRRTSNVLSSAFCLVLFDFLASQQLFLI